MTTVEPARHTDGGYGAVNGSLIEIFEGVELLHHYFEQACDRRPKAVAVVCGAARLTYAELDRRANRLAHLLRLHGTGPGHTVGILIDRSPEMYVALLGVLKAGAAFVPLDPSFPADRLAFIAADAGLHELVTTSAFRERTGGLGCPVLELDQAAAELAAQAWTRPGVCADPAALCYVIYTSGTTGKPKGVAVSHANIVSFLRAATPIYGVTAGDRVYQGLSLAFDFSVEEIWPAWIAGATLVTGPADARRLGHELTGFLNEHGVTVLCCVPTLLTTLEADVPSLRTLLVSGEACPADLVRRWSRPGRRMINAYGPTETTVTATCGELLPGRPVTLGHALPTYKVYILDEQLCPVEPGQCGELCIGGPGVAIGYLNRPELTAERFVPNPCLTDRCDSPRIYRSGDLGRLTPAGEIEYLGRIDTQVKIRGYRIELGEIEQVLREDPAVENAVVTPIERDGVVQDLVGYITLRDQPGQANGPGLRERLHASLRRRLPAYMVPSFVEVLEAFPMLAADKVDRSALPPPASAPLGLGSGPRVPARTFLEKRLVAAWEQALGVTGLSVTDDFFCDLGGHSLTAARLISELRRQPGTEALAIGDLYAHPTIRDLARFVEAAEAASADEPGAQATERPAPLRHSGARVLTCGLVQFAAGYVWTIVMSLPLLALINALFWTQDADVLTIPSPYEWLTFASLWISWLVLGIFVLPLGVGRLLIRGLRPGSYPLWGVTFLRCWLYGKLVGFAPVGSLTGTPLMPVYLRLLGAKVGRGCHLGAVGLPTLVEIGDEVSMGYGARVQPMYVEDGWMHVAPIRIGSGVFLGTNCVVQGGTDIGDGSSVGEQSLVHAGHRIPAGEHWAGSPIRRLEAAPPLLEAMAEQDDGRRWPVRVLFGFAAAYWALMWIPLLMFIPTATIVISVIVFAGLGWGLASIVVVGPLQVVVICLVVLAGKRAALPNVRAGIHPERSGFGVRKWMADAVIGMTLGLTHTLYSTLYLMPFLRRLGARTGRRAEVATVSFVDPDMLIIGEESFLADIAVVAPAVFHRGRIALAPAEVGRRSFVGNGALVPGSSHMGDNSLIGVHSVAPTARPIEAETTWLGSPAIFLPRRQASESFPEELTYAPTRRLIAWRLFIEYFRVTLPATIGWVGLYCGLYVLIKMIFTVSPLALVLLLPLVGLGFALAATLLVVVLKWLIIGRYRPRTEPLWSIWVRRTELITGLYEAVAVPALVGPFTGTPWIAPILRLFGARIGRRAWLATTYLTEFDLVEVGDDVAVGDATSLQTHLFEDRVMKMSKVIVGDGASIGVRSVVLYDSEVGPGACLDALSLVMKGELLPADTRWRGIPAAPAAERRPVSG